MTPMIFRSPSYTVQSHKVKLQILTFDKVEPAKRLALLLDKPYTRLID